jgi:hypothetical protein
MGTDVLARRLRFTTLFQCHFVHCGEAMPHWGLA